MKCPECGSAHKYSEGMICECGYAFALNPKSEALADARWLAIVSAASNAGSTYFTENGLYTAFCRRQTRWGFGLGRLFNTLFGPPSRNKMKNVLNVYESAKGRLDQLIRSPELYTPPPDWNEPDIYDYGVERLLITQRDLLVDLLVKNNFHMENRTLVISGVGYPEYLNQVAAKCLTDSPELPVFFLHDATREGLRWAAEMQADPGRLPWGPHPKIDLGLTPEDVKTLKVLRPLRPARFEYQLPVDALPYALLETGLKGAFEELAPFSALIALEGQRHVPDTTHFG